MARYMYTLKKSGIVTGHRMYKSIWTPSVREELAAEVKYHNLYEKCTVAFMKIGSVIGQISCSILCVCD